MSTGQVSAGYALGASTNKVKHRYPTLQTSIKKVKKTEMKLTIKQRIRNWIMDTNEAEADRGIYVEEDKLHSDGIRLQIYKASGGFVVETRGYDRRTDRNNHSMHVITDEQDLGEQLGKIVMMEALK